MMSLALSLEIEELLFACHLKMNVAVSYFWACMSLGQRKSRDRQSGMIAPGPGVSAMSSPLNRCPSSKRLVLEASDENGHVRTAF